MSKFAFWTQERHVETPEHLLRLQPRPSSHAHSIVDCLNQRGR